MSSTQIVNLSVKMKYGLEDCHGHVLLLENIPKILVMFLKNEGMLLTQYPADEAELLIVGREKKTLYEDWLYIYRHLFRSAYPTITAEKVECLARANAGYLLSVFTPVTLTCVFLQKQLNYVLRYFDWFTKKDYEEAFGIAIKKCMLEFLKITESLRTKDSIYDDEAHVSLFGNYKYTCNENFSEVFSTTYKGSYAQLYEIQSYSFGITYTTRPIVRVDYPQYFVPQIISHDKELVQKWLWEIRKPSIICPQGKIIEIAERGTCENFIRKAKRCFKKPSLPEASAQTYEILQKYLRNTEYYNKGFVHEQLNGVIFDLDIEIEN